MKKNDRNGSGLAVSPQAGLTSQYAATPESGLRIFREKQGLEDAGGRTLAVLRLPK
jgi:hypothetical protein